MKQAIPLLIGLLCAAPAAAGDTAMLNILGFSADGKTFAFEEFGTQDGSGFPFANRFYVDTGTDRFAPGTPIRVRIDDEAAAEKTARAQAATRGDTIVPSAQLAANPGFLAGFNAVTELSADRFSMTVNPRPVDPPIDAPLEIRLEEFDVPLKPGQCDGFHEIKGFRLNRVADGATTVLHEDTSIPGSRNCPIGYSIGGIQTFYPDGGQPVYAVMISVKSFGFEGPDYRWMAVTGRLQ